MYDVLIIGARCAGSALALMLARAGLKVAMIERATFPSDTMSGHYIHAAGVSWLRRWGLLHLMVASETPAIRGMSLDFGPVVLSDTPWPAADGTVEAFAPRRFVFDPLLAAAAIEAGAELRTGASFEQPMVDGGCVVGAQTISAEGRREALRARLVVGADGKRSRFARMVGAESYNCVPAAACTYYSYWSGFDTDEARLFVRPNRFYVVAPTNHGLSFVGIMWPAAAFRQVRADVQGAYTAALTEVPWLADRRPGARRAERFVGTADLDGFFRKPQGPGWALVGDAGYHKDPITAQGMTDAFLHAEMLAEAAIRGLSGAVPLDAELECYGKRRDEKAGPLYGLTADLARLAPPPPEMAALIDALADNPLETRRFLGLMAGTVPLPEFFAPENLAAIVGLRAAA